MGRMIFMTFTIKYKFITRGEFLFVCNDYLYSIDFIGHSVIKIVRYRKEKYQESLLL